jgi:hypothetical protein
MPRGRPDERVRLLFGPYRPPKLWVGDRTTCLFHDCEVIVTGWTDAPLSWPRCRRVEGGGRPGILVDEELARALRTEASLAVQYWCGVDVVRVWRWRKALGVGPRDPEGSRRLCQDVAEAAAAKVRGKKLPPEQVERRRRSAIENNLAQYLRPGYYGPWWTAEEIALLGTMPDEDVAQRIGAYGGGGAPAAVSARYPKGPRRPQRSKGPAGRFRSRASVLADQLCNAIVQRTRPGN